MKSQQDVENKLIEITAKLLEESGETHHKQINLDVSLQRHLGIDSLGRAELFRRIEKAYEVRLSDRLLAEAETLNDILAALLKKEFIIPEKQERRGSHGQRPSLDAGLAKSLVDVLLLYGEKAPNEVHIYFQNEDGHEEKITYGELFSSSLRVANGLRLLGLQHGETVALMQPTHPNFFYTFFGILLAGGIPVPIYPPFRMHMLEAYAQTEARILSNAEVRILVTFAEAEQLSRVLQAFVPSLKQVTSVAQLIKADELSDIFHAHGDHSALIQYTSGSTADPKGVLLSHHNLLANIAAYGKAIDIRPHDVAVSWLPLYHDMGLIGMWLGSLYYGLPLILMTPFSFLNHPERWLWAIHYHRGTVSGAPNFAYELCIRKIEKGLLEGLDLSSWRMAANGAEKIYPRTLRDFTKKFAPYGLKPTTLLPVYGLAESSVALTISPLEREFKIDTVDRKLFEEEREANYSSDKNALEFVSCGLPLAGHEIRIVDDEGKVLSERKVGNLQFRGPSCMQGYYNNPRATQAIYHDGYMDSGDLAYKAEGEIYITGRRKDLIIKAGRNLYPAELEEIAETVEGVRHGCVAAFEVLDAELGTEKLVIVAETRESSTSQREKMMDAIREIITSTVDIVPDQVILVAPHIIPKTSSGKLQRAACKKMYLQGELQKTRIPASMQMLKLLASAILHKCQKGLKMIARLIYTIYILLLVLLSFFPIYFYIRYASRNSAASLIKHWARWMMRFAFCPLKIAGKERLVSAPLIYAANHASYIDAIIMLAVLPVSTRIVVKKELYRLPMIRTILKKLDYLGIDRLDFSKGVEDTRRMESTLQAGFPIMIFPEGTFGYAAGLRPFRLGAFKLATETQTEICPLAIKGTRYLLRAEEKLMRPHAVTVTVCHAVKPRGLEWQHVTALRNEVRREILKYCGEPSLDFIAGQTVAASGR